MIYSNRDSCLPQVRCSLCVISMTHVLTLATRLKKQPLSRTSLVLWQRKNIWSTCQFLELPPKSGIHHFLSNFLTNANNTNWHRIFFIYSFYYYKIIFFWFSIWSDWNIFNKYLLPVSVEDNYVSSNQNGLGRGILDHLKISQ